MSSLRMDLTEANDGLHVVKDEEESNLKFVTGPVTQPVVTPGSKAIIVQ